MLGLLRALREMRWRTTPAIVNLAIFLLPALGLRRQGRSGSLWLSLKLRIGIAEKQKT
jgi:hypothetical protein